MSASAGAMQESTVREELLRIHARDGHISPEAVLIEAKDEASILHSHFTWDDGEAAEQWRLHEAGAMIRKFRVKITTEPDRTLRLREFVHVGPRQYKPIREAMKVPEQRDVIMGNAIREYRCLRAKYEDLIDFDEMVRRAVAG